MDGEANCRPRTLNDIGDTGRSCCADAGSISGLHQVYLPGPLGAFVCDGCCRQNAEIHSAGPAGEPQASKPQAGVTVGTSSVPRKSGNYVVAAAALRHPSFQPSPCTPAPTLLPTVRHLATFITSAPQIIPTNAAAHTACPSIRVQSPALTCLFCVAAAASEEVRAGGEFAPLRGQVHFIPLGARGGGWRQAIAASRPGGGVRYHCCHRHEGGV